MPTLIKQRYQFAASAFVRMWGHSSLHDRRIVEFCGVWAHRTDDAPLDANVDQYFYYEFKTWRGY
jgi:hypothetical protein